MKNFIINLMAKFGFELDTKEDKTPRDFLGETLEENPIRTLTDLIFQSERLNHLILIAEEKKHESQETLDRWQNELTEFIFNIDILISEFKVSKEEVKTAEEKAKSMLNMWILKKFTQFRWATREEDFS
jgi:ATP phosphoribosyltransferase